MISFITSWKKIFFIVGIFFFLHSPVQADNKIKGFRDPELKLILDSFQKAARNYSEVVFLDLSKQRSTLAKISFRFTDIADGLDGQCECSEEKKLFEIRFPKGLWHTFSRVKREILTLHELGHCVLGRMHDDRLAAVGSERIPASIMRTITLDEGFYEKHREYYWEELFLGAALYK